MKRNLLPQCTLAGLFALALSTAPVLAQDNEFDTWDANSDAALDSEEFATGLRDAGVYDNWDADGDDCITDAEFQAGVGDNTDAFNEVYGETAYADWDANSDGCLDEDEFYNGIYDTADVDDDQVLTPDEFGARSGDLGEGGLFDL